MTQHLEATAETVVTIKLSKEHAVKLAHSLGRALEATSHLDPSSRYTALVNTGTIDDLLSLKTALFTVTE
jgi:hypothetical protein